MQKFQSTNQPHEHFYEHVGEVVKALDNLKIIPVHEHGIKAVFKELDRQNIQPAFGSLRIDRDKEGRVFIKEYRPSPSLFRTGYFHSIDSQLPFWEKVGSAIIRLSENKIRLLKEPDQQPKGKKSWFKKGSEFCIILQGNMDKNYLKILIEQGRISYDTNKDNLREENIFSALEILSKTAMNQIIEIRILNKQFYLKEIGGTLLLRDKSTRDIACIIGRKTDGALYTAPGEYNSEISENDLNLKVGPVEVSREINLCGDALVREKKMLILDEITLEDLKEFLKNAEAYYTELSEV
ncbi:MAG: hypothetical protein AB7T22_06465 [Calditrichaceae bacterium]